MIYYIDIDNTICITNNSDYQNSVPIVNRIDTINKLFDEGHTIIYWTARGSVSGKNWLDFTENQLKIWKCKYHDIKIGKPNYDLFIEDKSIHPKEFFNES